MSESFDSIAEPIPISLIAGRYLLFDVNVVTYLRRTHHICGVLTGTLPQIPQQNVFLSLPVELMPEEARLLVDKEIAYIVDDSAWHKERFITFSESDKRQYLDSLRSKGLEARKNAEGASRKKTEIALARIAAARKSESGSSTVDHSSRSEPSEDISDLLFGDNRSSSRASALPESQASTQTLPPGKPWAVTPTTSYSPSTLPQNPIQQPDPPVPSAYHLFAHLHSKNYWMMPGLRFGCDYNVYPGDPLRFHSHFSAVSYDWDEEISMIDLIGGGRLGTRVKKGFLIGGKDTNTESEEGDHVRTFNIEWAGM
jgi:tRNA-splicing endonuclease subunit Sen34